MDNDNSILNYVLSKLPAEWENVPIEMYSVNNVLFPLCKNTYEYEEIAMLFYNDFFHIKSIQRLQNPFQYGRYALRQEMLHLSCEETVFHAVHKSDIKTALKFTCDFRRYTRPFENVENDYYPRFYDSISSLLQHIVKDISHVNPNDLCVLVLNKLLSPTMTQCDYYIKFVAEFL